MFKDGSTFSDASSKMSAPYLSARRDLSSAAMTPLRNRWPFTVGAAYLARTLAPADGCALAQPKATSPFIT